MKLQTIEKGCITIELYADECYLFAQAFQIAHHGAMESDNSDSLGPTNQRQRLLYQHAFGALAVAFEGLTASTFAHSFMSPGRVEEVTLEKVREEFTKNLEAADQSPEDK